MTSEQAKFVHALGQKSNDVMFSPDSFKVSLLFQYLETTVLTLGRSNILDVIALALRSTVLVFYCSVTNFHKLRCFKQYPFIRLQN